MCSNRAATQTNVLKPQEKDQRDNMLICRCFAHSGNRQQCIVLLSHGRGRWFEPSIAHSKISCKRKKNTATYICTLELRAATVQQRGRVSELDIDKHGDETHELVAKTIDEPTYFELKNRPPTPLSRKGQRGRVPRALVHYRREEFEATTTSASASSLYSP